MEIGLGIKKNEVPDICNKMDGIKDHYSQWNKKDTDIAHFFLYMDVNMYNKYIHSKTECHIVKYIYL